MDNSTQVKPAAEKIFLIDFENVHEKGLEGIGDLRPEDTVHLFYTKNAAKISLDILSEIQAKLCFHKVNVGKQSLDMQLVSYLGFLIGTVGKEPEYVIVSNDAGFHNTLAFWGEKDTKISQMKSMKAEKAEEPARVSQQNQRPAQARSASAPRSPYRMRAQAQAGGQQPVSVVPAAAAPAKAEIQQPAAVPAPAAPAVPEAPAAVPAASPAAVQAEEPVSAHTQDSQNGHPVRGATEKTQMNNKITVALRDRKVENEKIGKATATVMKLYGSKNFRQAAYREMIKLFGQKEGLELYNIIRPILPAAVPAQRKPSSGKRGSRSASLPASEAASEPASPASPESADNSED